MRGCRLLAVGAAVRRGNRVIGAPRGGAGRPGDCESEVGGQNTHPPQRRLASRPVFPVAFTRLAWLLLILVELNGAPDRFLVAPLARPAGKRFRRVLWPLVRPRVFLAGLVPLSLSVLLAEWLLLFHGAVLP